MNKFYSKAETLPKNEIEKYHIEQINNILSHVRQTPYYKGKLPEKIQSLSEFSHLPLISKNKLREAFPYGFLSVPPEEIVRYNASSGTTGIPTLSFCTKEDLDEMTKNEALHYSHAGLSDKDIIQSMTGFNLYTAGWGCYHAALELGAAIIPSGPGNTKRQIDLLKQLKAEFCFSTPGYLQHLLETMTEEDFKEISLKVAMTGGEVLTKGFQKLAKEKYNIEVYNFYGMTEFATHIGSECHMHNGLHINEDYFYAEIIDSKTGEVLPDGEYGELVLTDLKRKAMPLIRYRTRDITRIIPENCPCGRTHKRIEAIQCRIDDMMIINGVNVFPSQIEESIYKHLPVATNYLLKISEKNGLKKLSVTIEIPDDLLNNKEQLEKFEKDLMKTLKSYITITPVLNFVPLQTLPECSGKTNRIIIDNNN